MNSGESMFTQLRFEELSTENVFKMLGALINKGSYKFGEHHLDTQVSRQAVLHAVENSVLPLVRKGKKLRESISILKFLISPEIVISSGAQKIERDDQPLNESQMFSKELTHVLLKNADAFLGNFRNISHGPTLSALFLDIVDAAKMRERMITLR